MEIKITVLLFCILIAVECRQNKKEGVDVFFETNLDEMQDVAIKFNQTLPLWLKGSLIRNGLGRFEVGSRKFKNALDAFGKLSSWTFSGNGSAYFSTRMIYSKSYNESLAANDIAPYLMLDSVDPAFGIVEELESFRNGPDNMNVNIFNFGGDKNDFAVVSDYWNVYSVDPYTLQTIEGIHPPIPNVNPFDSLITLSSAHPLPEYGTSNYLTFVSVAPPIPQIKSKLIFMRIKSASEREVIATIEVDKASYMHSFAVTQNYAVLFAVPFYVNPSGMFKDFKPLDAFEWVSTDVTKLYVINLKTGFVKTMKTENMFFLHVANAYEYTLFGNEIIVDVCTYKNTSEMHMMGMAELHNPAERRNSGNVTLKRYTLDLAGDEVDVYTYENSEDVGVDVNHLDFPTINEKYRSEKIATYTALSITMTARTSFTWPSPKKDVCGGKGDKSWYAHGMFFNEAYFIPKPDGVAEDDGILILPVLDSLTQTTNITIFDAKDLTFISTALLPRIYHLEPMVISLIIFFEYLKMCFCLLNTKVYI